MANYIRILFLINLITAILKSIKIQIVIKITFFKHNYCFSIYQHELFNYDLKSWK